jgi:hypothetical protein
MSGDEVGGRSGGDEGWREEATEKMIFLSGKEERKT